MISNQKLPILVVGATGQLGSLITKHCLKQPNLQVNILVRNPDKNKELIEEIEKTGGKVIKGDVTKPETLTDCTKGIHTVISALIGDDDTVEGGQKALLQDALKNDVKRMVPSDFSLLFDKIPEDEHPFLGQRIRFKKALAATPIKGLHIYNGMFTETFFYFMANGLHYYQNLDQKIDTTTYEDTARYVAAAVAKPDRVGDLKVRGDEFSMNEFVEKYNKVTGKQVKLQNWGTIEDLKKKIVETREKGEFFKAALLGYEVPMFDGRGKMDHVDNDEFLEIKPMNMEEFIKAYPERTMKLS